MDTFFHGVRPALLQRKRWHLSKFLKGRKNKVTCGTSGCAKDIWRLPFEIISRRRGSPWHIRPNVVLGKQRFFHELPSAFVFDGLLKFQQRVAEPRKNWKTSSFHSSGGNHRAPYFSKQFSTTAETEAKDFRYCWKLKKKKTSHHISTRLSYNYPLWLDIMPL